MLSFILLIARVKKFALKISQPKKEKTLAALWRAESVNSQERKMKLSFQSLSSVYFTSESAGRSRGDTKIYFDAEND